MNIVTMIFCIITAAGSFLKERNFLNPLTILGGLWAVIIAGASMKLYGLYEASDKTYSLIFVGLISFFIGYVLMSLKFMFKSPLSSNVNKCIKKYEINLKFIYGVCIICIIFLLIDLSVVIKYLLEGNGLAYVRALCQDPNSLIYSRRSGIENLIRTIFVLPASFAIAPITAIDFCSEKKHNTLLGLYITIIALRIFTEGGRVVVAYFLLHILIASVFFKKKLNVKKYITGHKRLAILALILLGIIAMVYATISRSNENSERHMYYYITMQPVMFETWANITNQENLTGYGLASLNGFLYPIIYFIKNFFGYTTYPGYWGKIVHLIETTDSQWVWMSSYGRANAFVSLFFFFYLDGREFGIILGMFIYGVISAYIYTSVKRRLNRKNLCIYSLIAQGLLFSMVRLQFANVTYALAFMYVMFAFKRKYIAIENKQHMSN